MRFVVFLYVMKFTESVAQWFADVELFCKVQVMQKMTLAALQVK